MGVPPCPKIFSYQGLWLPDMKMYENHWYRDSESVHHHRYSGAADCFFSLCTFHMLDNTVVTTRHYLINIDFITNVFMLINTKPIV